MLVPLSIALAGLVTTKRVSYRGASYGATVVPATTPGRPALVLLPPIGVGIDRTFCGQLVDAWAEAAPGPALHAIDVLGVGDSEPKPRMRRPFGGWDQVRVRVRVGVRVRAKLRVAVALTLTPTSTPTLAPPTSV